MSNVRFRSSNSAVSTVIGAILVLGLIVSVIALFKVVYIPEMKKQAESDHMQNVLSDMMDHKSRIDAAAAIGRGIVTTNVEMGGGSIPLIDPGSSSGALGIDPSYGSLIITAYNQSGTNLGTDLTNMGSITYSSNNNYWLDQKYHYESGMLILSQAAGHKKLGDPCMSVRRDPGNSSNITVMMFPIRINDQASSVASTQNEMLTSTIFPENCVHREAYVNNVSISVTSIYAGEWESYFEEIFTGAGLVKNVNYSVVRIDDTVDATVYFGGENIRLHLYDTTTGSPGSSTAVTTSIGLVPELQPSTMKHKDNITVSLIAHVTNYGDSTANNVCPQVRYDLHTGNFEVYLISPPSPVSVNILPGETHDFIWVYNIYAGSNGYADFNITASGSNTGSISRIVRLDCV
ncbi:hypothetical protein CUJ83_13735 [Methanocella sp. CWC-04]|uniref:Uncharacterized protein n=1 Tax=Methanooceanicella nereidis TaxID=2052831 RepID=A0AAP2RG98_9EURY|nr:hypothetical protein [Methanocella sp. CWC-04]MCD1296060.1 hypothetical protein [Methanocella sp. CWC-04]